MGPISPAKHRTPGASLADANAAAHSSQSAHAPAAGYTRPPDIDNRATLINRFVWMLESFAWNWVYWAPMKALAVRQASEAGAAILRRVGPLSKVHTTITRNLRLAFPEWSDARIAETAGSAWETLGRIAGELPHSKEMAPYGSSHIEVVGAERLDAIRQSGKPAIFFSGHLANWELMLPAICQRGIACTTSYRSLNIPMSIAASTQHASPAERPPWRRREQVRATWCAPSHAANPSLCWWTRSIIAASLFRFSAMTP